LFTILGAYLDESTSDIIKSLLKNNNLEVDFLSIQTNTENKYCLADIDLFLVSMDSYPNNAISLLHDIHDSKNNCIFLVILFSKDKTKLVEGFFCIGGCRYFFLPLTEKDQRILTSFILLVYKNLEFLLLTQQKQENCLSLGSGNHTYHIPFYKIFFIESIQHKCLVHTIEEVITVIEPLYKIKERCPPNLLVQCHRSFLVNPDYARYIDKSLEPWIIYFKNYPQKACLSRRYRKDFIQTYLKKYPIQESTMKPPNENQ